MCNMELSSYELSLVILGMESLMEQLKDDWENDVVDEYENRKKYYDCWEIANKANKARTLLSQK